MDCFAALAMTHSNTFHWLLIGQALQSVATAMHGDRVRLITRGGYNWSKRYPWIVEAARKVRQSRFVLNGGAVVLGVDGVSNLNALHARK